MTCKHFLRRMPAARKRKVLTPFPTTIQRWDLPAGEAKRMPLPDVVRAVNVA